MSAVVGEIKRDVVPGGWRGKLLQNLLKGLEGSVVLMKSKIGIAQADV